MPVKFVEDLPWKVKQECDIEAKDRVERMGKMAKMIVDSGESYDVKGCAGFGKTWLLKQIFDLLETSGVKVEKIAPSNDAARIIGGRTIHSLLGIKWTGEIHPGLVKQVAKLDVLLIDECSMVGHDLLRIFYKAKLANPKLRFIWFGDREHQLPPVENVDYDYENLYIIKFLSDFNQLRMTEYKRGDKKLYFLCMKAFNNLELDPTDFGDFSIDEAEVHLCWTNVARMELNHKFMDQAAEGEDHLAIQATDHHIRRSNDLAQDVKLIVGTPIRAESNAKEWTKGDCFKVKSWDDENITLSFQHDQEDIIVDHETFMCKFCVAHAITIHKCQGKSYPFKYCIWETSKMIKKANTGDKTGRRLLYVSTSRAEQVEGMKTQKLIKIVQESPPTTLQQQWRDSKVYLMRGKKSKLKYVGSTWRKLEKRLAEHKGNWRKKKAGKYRYDDAVFKIFENEDSVDDVVISVLEECKCRKRSDLTKYEGKWIKRHDCVNKRHERTEDED